MMHKVMPVLLVGALLAACGGGATDIGRQPEPTGSTVTERLRSVTQANVVVTAAQHAGAVGSFDPVHSMTTRGAHALRAADATAQFRYEVRLPMAGDYRVYAWWPEAVAGAGEVVALVEDRLGTTKVQLDQSQRAGQWVALGVFSYAPGRPARVTFASAGSAQVVADGLRFEHMAGVSALTWVTEELPLANQDKPYLAELEAAGRPPLRWSVVGGELPPGLTLDARSGQLSGVPGGRGAYQVQLEVRDARGLSAVRALQLDVLESADEPVTQPQRLSERARSSGSASLDGLVALLDAIPEGSWVQANLNSYSSTWTPPELRPLKGLSNPDPSNIIQAWSSFAWDSKRGDLLIYGGGHANYGGNDMYRWRGSTRMWERASLPSQIRTDDLGNVNAIDGVYNAPASAHTYDNSLYLPISDRFVTFGGAVFGRGGPYRVQVDATTDRPTGPYFFDPSRADAWKVGGTTGSHVQRVAPYPEIVGGHMWSNRDLPGTQPVGTRMPTSYVSGCSGYAVEHGRDVVYVAGRPGGTALQLYRYTVHDVNNPALDTIEQVGRYWEGTSRQTTCAVDPHTNLVLRTGENPEPFFYWNLATAAPANRDVPMVPTDPTGEFNALLASNTINITLCGMDYDPVRRHYVLWCGGGSVWAVTPPPGPATPTGWTVSRISAPVGAVPTQDVGKGILGKWKYIPNLDAFIGLQDIVHGNIWIYKPVGWVRPVAGPPNAAPEVSWVAPASGSVFASGSAIELEAAATDPDGSIVKVEFYSGVAKIGETSSGPPYRATWASAPIGTHALRAVATDNLGAIAASATIEVTVEAGASGTLTLQEGAGGYSGTRDTYLSSYHPSRAYGGDILMQDQYARYSVLMRFAIFAHQGGPLPDAAAVTSARLMVYKYSKYNMVYRLHPLLVDWNEAQATWSQRVTGVPWGAPGARLAGTDHASVADATASVGYDPGWVVFDVTGAVQRMQSGPNFGWVMLGDSGYTSGLKRFYTRESVLDPGLRPKLEVTYASSP
jgi:hypothetical protein